MRTLRIAILGPSPCERCYAACCKQNGHDYAVLLEADEPRRFAPWTIDAAIDTGQGAVIEKVLPYRDGRCVFLGSDDRCTIYEDRPQACRRFECTRDLYRTDRQTHGRFLRLNPPVLKLLESI